MAIAGHGEHPVIGALSGAFHGSPIRREHEGGMIGHFMMAIDPGLFPRRRRFRADVASVCDTLRATRPADPAKPVQVSGRSRGAH